MDHSLYHDTVSVHAATYHEISLATIAVRNRRAFIQHPNISAKFPFSVGTPGTNRNNGCPWEGLQEKIAITSGASVISKLQRSTNQSKEEQKKFYLSTVKGLRQKSCTVNDSTTAWVEDVLELLVNCTRWLFFPWLWRKVLHLVQERMKESNC